MTIHNKELAETMAHLENLLRQAKNKNHALPVVIKIILSMPLRTKKKKKDKP